MLPMGDFAQHQQLDCRTPTQKDKTVIESERLQSESNMYQVPWSNILESISNISAQLNLREAQTN